MPNNSIPAGYHSLTPSIIVRRGEEAVEFYRRAFGATVRQRLDMPDGKIMHAELEIDGSVFMLSDESPAWKSFAPESVGGTSSALHLYVADVDAAFARAVEAGATPTMPPADMFWGDRAAYLMDPFGHRWGVATRVEEVSEEETQRRAEAFLKESGAA